MKRIVGGVLCLLLLGAVALSLGRGLALAPATHVYTVDQVQAGLRRYPTAWVGKTVAVRGWISSGGGMNCTQAMDSTCAAHWVRLDATAGFNPRTSGSAAFDVMLPHGMQPDRLYSRGWAALLSFLPGVGSNLTATTLRVRLTVPPPPCTSATGPCTSGVFVP